MISKKTIILIGLLVLVSAALHTMALAESEATPEMNDVVFAPNAIGIPLGRILLIRKGNEYGVVKFTQCWTGKTKYDQHAEYESYYQGD